MDFLFGMCCATRSKDQMDRSDPDQKPVDFIEKKPNLIKVLKWFDEIEDQTKQSMIEISEPLENIIQKLDEHSDEATIEVTNGHEMVTKVVEKTALDEILKFDEIENKTMQTVIESYEFFKVQSNDGDSEIQQYDFNKIILFLLLFCDETPANKVTCLFYLMCDDQNIITSRNEQVRTMIAMLTIICCMVPAEIIKFVSFSLPAQKAKKQPVK